MAVWSTAMARAATVGPVAAGLARMVWSSSSSHLTTALSLKLVGTPSIGQIVVGSSGSSYAAAAGLAAEKVASIDRTSAVVRTRVVASFRFTCASLSPALQAGSGDWFGVGTR